MTEIVRGHRTIEELFKDYSDMVFRIALHNTQSIPTAEDITQEVFMKIVEKDIIFESAEHEKAWLIRVTINLCTNHFRSGWYKKRAELTENIAAADSIALSIEQKELLDTLSQLKKQERDVIYLSYYEGYTIDEIAKLLRCKRNTIASQLRRAKLKLKDMLEGGNSYGKRFN